MTQGKQEIFAWILDAITEVDDRVDVSGIHLDETPFRVHGLTSLTHLQMCVAVADRLGIAFDDADALLAGSPLTLTSLLEERLAA